MLAQCGQTGATAVVSLVCPGWEEEVGGLGHTEKHLERLFLCRYLRMWQHCLLAPQSTRCRAGFNVEAVRRKVVAKSIRQCRSKAPRKRDRAPPPALEITGMPGAAGAVHSIYLRYVPPGGMPLCYPSHYADGLQLVTATSCQHISERRIALLPRHIRQRQLFSARLVCHLATAPGHISAPVSSAQPPTKQAVTPPPTSSHTFNHGQPTRRRARGSSQPPLLPLICPSSDPRNSPGPHTKLTTPYSLPQGASVKELLIEACRRNNTDLLHEVLESRTDDEIAALLNTTTTVMGNHLYHEAASHGNYEVIDALLDAPGFERDPVNRLEGDTPLHSAVRWVNSEFPRSASSAPRWST